MIRHLKVLSLILLFGWYGCQYLPWGKKESKPIFIGEPEAIIVEPPEDAFDVSYRWAILDLPDESMLVPDFSSQSNLFTFTADVEGDYAFAATVVSYGEEVSDHKFYFTALEDTSVVPREELAAAAAAPEAKPKPPVTARPRPVATTTVPPTKPKPAPAKVVTRAKPAAKIYRSDVIEGHFTVQVSSWKTAKQAQRVLQQVAETGYDAYIQRVWLEDRNEVWWRVRIGDFTSVEGAKALQKELNAIYPGVWVDNVRKEDIDQQQ